MFMATASESAALTAGGQAISNLLTPQGTPSSSFGQTISESGGNTSGQISEEGRATRRTAYDELVKILGDTSYTRESAIKDSEGAVADLFKQYSITDLPKIYSNQNSTGGYNSTGHQLLANDAFASTVAKGAALRQKAIVDYAGARNKENFGSEFSYTVREEGSTGASGGGNSKGDAAAQAVASLIAFNS
jgi:hypothetical protein